MLALTLTLAATIVIARRVHPAWRWSLAPLLFVLVMPWASYTVEGWRLVAGGMSATQPFADSWWGVRELVHQTAALLMGQSTSPEMGVAGLVLIASLVVGLGMLIREHGRTTKNHQPG